LAWDGIRMDSNHRLFRVKVRLTQRHNNFNVLPEAAK
jgi:hypothetical protein